MRCRLLLTVTLLLLSAALVWGRGSGRPVEAEWTDEQTDALLALAREYAAAGGRRAQDAVLERAAALGPVSSRERKKVVKALFEVAREGPKSEGKGECTAHFDRFPGTYLMTGAGGGKKGVFIGLHGGGAGVGHGGTAASQWGGATGKGLIGIFPTANLPGRATTWQSPEVEAFIIEILLELKRTYKIDTNRIYVAGHSLGGSGAWNIGLSSADLFASVSPNAGGCRGQNKGDGTSVVPGGYVANLFNTPIFFTHYDLDPRVDVKDARAVAKELGELQAKHPNGYEHVYIEGKGVNHGFPPGGDTSKIISWMTRHKRDPYPKKVIWEPGNSERRMFFWLRHARPPAGGNRNSRIVATIAKNRVEVSGPLVRGLSVFLAEEMFDPNAPVTVVMNGETKFEGLVTRNPAALLESILTNIDENQVFAYRIDL